MDQNSAKLAFLEAFDAYSDAIFRFALMKTSNKEVSEDLTQETFMRYWQSVREGKPMTNTRSFLYTIANNLVIDWYRKKKADSLDARMDAGFEPAGKETGPQGHAEYQEALKVIERLEEQDREVLLLRYVEGLEPKDIAGVLGETANVISVRIHRAEKRLREELGI